LNNRQIFIASGNQGKIKEIADLLSPFGVKIESNLTIDKIIDEPEETEDNFKGNAILKSRYYCHETGYISISDDSGLEVESLDGEPGIYSARWAEDSKGNRDFYFAMETIEQKLNEKNIVTRASADGYDKELLKANFTCALAVSWPNGEEVVFEGKVFGHLSFPPKGERGFGYDPIFIADGYEKTFAEIEPSEKHSISHRANAFKQLVEQCFEK
jgi:XTP/dITP diphosphohydrolase